MSGSVTYAPSSMRMWLRCWSPTCAEAGAGSPGAVHSSMDQSTQHCKRPWPLRPCPGLTTQSHGEVMVRPILLIGLLTALLPYPEMARASGEFVCAGKLAVPHPTWWTYRYGSEMHPAAPSPSPSEYHRAGQAGPMWVTPRSATLHPRRELWPARPVRLRAMYQREAGR